MNTPNRRTFLLSAAATASATAFAAEEEKPVRVAVVGTGGRGSDLIRALSTIDSAQVAAICDDYPPHLEKASKYAGTEAKTFNNFAAMLKEIRPQAVVIATPLHLHHGMVLEALNADAAVFCEKTLCRTVAEAKEVAAEVEKRKAVFQIGLQRRSNAIYRQAVAMVKAGMLGRISAIKCQWHRNNNWRRPVPFPKNDPQWPALERKLNWRLYKEYSGGLMTELGSHQLDVANWILGTTPKRAFASGGIDSWKDGRDVFDNIFCVYEYAVTPKEKNLPPEKAAPYTVRATYSSIQNNAFEGASELIMGSQGTLLLTQKKGLFYKEGGPDMPWGIAGKAADDAAVITSGKTLKLDNDPWAYRGKPYEIDADSDDTRDELVDFVKSVRSGNRQTTADVQTGLQDCATVLMANDSANLGRWVDYPA
jgi:predicted dehydrogenase